jgi:hypothetical protein
MKEYGTFTANHNQHITLLPYSMLDSPRPSEPTYIIMTIWHTSSEETYVVKIAFAKQIRIYENEVNVVKHDQRDWESNVPPSQIRIILDGRGVTFKTSVQG